MNPSVIYLPVKRLSFMGYPMEATRKKTRGECWLTTIKASGKYCIKNSPHSKKPAEFFGAVHTYTHTTTFTARARLHTTHTRTQTNPLPLQPFFLANKIDTIYFHFIRSIPISCSYSVHQSETATYLRMRCPCAISSNT